MLERRRALDDCSEVVKQSGRVYDVTEFFSHGTNHILQLAYAITKNLFLGDSTAQQQSEMPNVPQPTCSDKNNSTYPVDGDGQARKTAAPAFHGLRITGWIDAFLKYPRAYLVLSTCIDHSLATGRLPRNELLPPLMRGTVSVILGLPKLPWTITAPTSPRDVYAERKSIEERRRPRDSEHGSSTSTAMSLVERRNPSLDDTWYWTLMHNVPGGSQSMGPVPGYIDGEIPHNSNDTANTASSSEGLETGYYPNSSLNLNFHLFDPVSGET